MPRRSSVTRTILAAPRPPTPPYEATSPAISPRRRRRYLRSRRSDNTDQTITHTAVAEGTTISQPKTDSSDDPSWFNPYPAFDPNEGYVPFPRITFLIDKPPFLLCQICQDTRCRLLSSSAAPTDETIAILPCGHVAGAACMEECLHSKLSCPFCRQVLQYPGCGHPINPFLLTKESAPFVPKTVPDGGVIPEKCSSCAVDEAMAVARDEVEDLARQFKTLRLKVGRQGCQEDREALLEVKKQLDQCILSRAVADASTQW